MYRAPSVAKKTLESIPPPKYTARFLSASARLFKQKLFSAISVAAHRAGTGVSPVRRNELLRLSLFKDSAAEGGGGLAGGTY